MKLCMIGCGSFARQFHGPAQQRCVAEQVPVELVACCDIDADRARDYGAAFGFARHYSETFKMLAAEKPDAVVMAVPPEFAGAAADLVLTHGFPLLLEKPPGVSSPELARLIEAAAIGGAKVQVGFNRRHMPVMRWAKSILDTAFVDTPVTRIDYEMIRFDRWDRDFSTTAVHAIDAVRFLAGPFRTAAVDYHPHPLASREATSVSLRLRCASGASAQVTIQPVAGLNAECAKIHAVGQSLVIKLPFPGKPAGDGTAEHWRGDELVARFSDAGCDVVDKMGIMNELKAFLTAVRDRSGFSPSLEDCRQQVKLMESIRLRRTGPIDLVVQQPKQGGVQ